MKKLGATAVLITLTAACNLTGPDLLRGFGGYDPETFPPLFTPTSPNTVAVDIWFRGDCGVQKWDVQATQTGHTVVIVPYSEYTLTNERCATGTNFKQTFHFPPGAASRFVIRSSLGDTGPPAIQLDTILPLH